MGKGAVFSGLLHLAVVLLTIFGLPWLYDTNDVLQVTEVSVISEAQFAELKNQKPPAQQKKAEQPKEQEIPPAPPAPDVAQPEPEPEEPAPPEPAPQPVAQPEPAPEPPPQAEPPQQAEQQQPVVQPEPPPEPPQEQVAVAPEPQPEPKPQPVVPPEPQVAEAQPKPVPPKKPDPPKKKEDPKKKEKDKPKDQQAAADDLSWLPNLEKKANDRKKKQKSQPQQNQQAALPPDNYDGPPITEGEKDMIRQQVKGNWIIDIGMQGLEEMTVEVKVRMNPDGSVQAAKADPSSSNGHPNWPIFARSCENAVLKSSPLRMPPDKPYAAWATMTLVFNAREMLGY